MHSMVVDVDSENVALGCGLRVRCVRNPHGGGPLRPAPAGRNRRWAGGRKTPLGVARHAPPAVVRSSSTVFPARIRGSPPRRAWPWSASADRRSVQSCPTPGVTAANALLELRDVEYSKIEKMSKALAIWDRRRWERS